MYGRPHCFVMEHLSPQGTRLVAMQAFDESSKQTWMRILASSTQVQAPLPIQRSAAAGEAPRAQHQDLAASSESRAQPGGKGTASSSSSGSGKGTGKGPPVPPSGKGASKGPGKGKGHVPPLPLGKGKGKAQPKAKASAKSLPFGKRLNMRDSGALPQTARGEQPSIFQGLFAKRAGQAQEDIDTLRSLFSETKASPGSGATSGTVSLAPSATPRKIFPDAVARNCQIVLRGLALRGPELVEAVKCLEPGPLDQDQLERLAQMMPEASLMSQLDREAKGPCPSPLRDVEQQMVPFSQLGRLQERLKALILAANLQPQELRLMAQMQAVREACTQMRESSSLKHVLATVLVMYNYVNYGQVERAEARAFDIANLLHLNEFRADHHSGPFPKFTALHYVAMRLLADESDESSGFHAKSIRTLQAELHRVSEAAGICLKYVSTSIEQLTEDIRKLREEQRANATVYGGTVDVEEPAPAPSPAPPPVPTPPVARRLTELSEVSECEEMTPRVDLIPQQTPRCGARAAAWLRQVVGQLGPAELSDLARGASQQCPSSTWLLMHDGINGTRSRKVFVTVSELGVLCYSESMANPETVRCLPLIGAEIGPTQSPNGFEITCLAKPGCTNKMSFRFQAPDLQASFLWQNALQAASMRAGAGWLEVCSAFTWKCRWVVILTIPSTTSRGASRMSDGSRCSASLRAGSRWLLWFRSPEEMLVGDICGSVELGSTEVFNRNPRAHSFRVGYIQHRSGGEALSNLSLRARDEAEMDRWVEFIRSPPSQPQPPQPAPVMDTGRCSQESISHRSSECSISSPGSGGSRVFVPRLNLGACGARLESARSSQSKDSRASLTTASTTHSSPSPQKDLRRAKKKDRDRDTLWTEIHRDIITPRPGLATAPRIVDRQTCDSSSEDSDSDSESTQTISEPEAAVPSPGPELATRAGSSTGLLTARLRHLNADVSSVSTYARMTALADEAESTVERLTSSLNETLEEGKRLLLFLGQKPPQNSSEASQVELGVSVRSVFDTVNKFMHLLKGAVGDVERFQSRSSGRGSPAKSAPSSNYGFYRRRRSSASCARVISETDQCNQLARDCVLRAVCRACKVDVQVAAVTRVPKRGKAGQRLPAPPTEVVPVACAFDELD